MSQQGSNTTFRVGGTARQAGGNWTGRFENPEGLNAWHSMYGNRVEPGDTVTVGDAILKWTGSAYKVIDGDFVNGPTANAWAAKFSPALASGSTATAAGVQVTYQGAGVGWVDALNQWDDDALLVIGDSRTFAEGGLSVNGANDAWTYYAGARGPVTWMQSMLLDSRFKRVHARGRSGIRAFDIATDFNIGWHISELLSSSDARHVLIRLGTNDLNISSTFTADEIASNLAVCVSAVIDQGRIAHISTIEPRDLIDGYTIANTIKGLALNALIKERFGKMERCYVVDISTPFTNWSEKTKFVPDIGASTAVVADGLHASVRGGYVGGLALKSHFAPFRKKTFFAGSNHYLSTKANSPSESKQLLTNPLMDGGISNIGGTGITFSTVAAPNGVGSALRIDVADTAASGVATLSYMGISVNAADLVPGAQFWAYARVKISGAGGTGAPVGLKSIAILADLGNNGGAKNGTQIWWDNNDGTTYAIAGYCEFSGELLLVTPRYTVRSSSDRIDAPYFWIYSRQTSSPAYRLEIYDCGVLMETPTTADKFPQFFSNEIPPVWVY